MRGFFVRSRRGLFVPPSLVARLWWFLHFPPAFFESLRRRRVGPRVAPSTGFRRRRTRGSQVPRRSQHALRDGCAGKISAMPRFSAVFGSLRHVFPAEPWESGEGPATSGGAAEPRCGRGGRNHGAVAGRNRGAVAGRNQGAISLHRNLPRHYADLCRLNRISGEFS